MKMHNPPHPGEIIREQCLEPLGPIIAAAAKGLGVTRKALSELENGCRNRSKSPRLHLQQLPLSYQVACKLIRI